MRRDEVEREAARTARGARSHEPREVPRGSVVRGVGVGLTMGLRVLRREEDGFRENKGERMDARGGA